MTKLVALLVMIGCAARQDPGATTVLGQRVQQLEAEVTTLKTAPVPRPAPAKPSPPPLALDTSGLNDLRVRVTALEAQQQALNVELEKLIFGDVLAVDVKPRGPGRPRPETVYSVPIKGNPSDQPDDTAMVTWVVGIELTEPYSRRLLETMKSIRAAYGKELRIVFKSFVVHDSGIGSAMVLCGAHMQAKFDQAIAALLAIPLGDISPFRYAALRAHMTFLDRAQLENDVRGACRTIVREDHEIARRLAQAGTPYSFINGRNVNGAQSEEAFRKVIDEELTKANAELKGGSSKGYYDRIIKRGATMP